MPGKNCCVSEKVSCCWPAVILGEIVVQCKAGGRSVVLLRLVSLFRNEAGRSSNQCLGCQMPGWVTGLPAAIHSPAALAAVGLESSLALDKAIDNLFRAVLFQQHIIKPRVSDFCLFSRCSFLARPGKYDNVMENGLRAHSAHTGGNGGERLGFWQVWVGLLSLLPSLPCLLPPWFLFFCGFLTGSCCEIWLVLSHT